MSANIATINGHRSFVGGVTGGWHRLGVTLPELFTLEEAFAANPGVDFEVIKRQLEFEGKKIEQWGTFRRDKDGTLTYFAPCGENYEVLQSVQVLQVGNAIVGSSSNGAHFSTIGALGKGERVFAVIDLRKSIWVGDDESKCYLGIITSHDGSLKTMFFQTSVRMVCQNTVNIALRTAVQACFSTKHTKNAATRLDRIREGLDGVADEFESLQAKLNFLNSRVVTRESIDDIMARIFEHDPTVKNTKRRDTKLADIMRTWENNDNDAFPDQRGTAYSLLSSVTNYQDYRSGHDARRNEISLLGEANDTKNRALEILFEAAQTLPTKSAYQRMQSAAGLITVDAPASTSSVTVARPTANVWTPDASETPFLASLLSGDTPIVPSE